MNQTLVYIGDDALDLYPDTIVALTKKANEVGDLTTRNLSYTNQFKIPFTETNDQIYELSRLVQSESLIPYRKQTCRVLQNGIEIVSNGIAVLKRASSSYEIFVLSGAADFFSTIKDLDLTDLDFSDFNTTWDADTIISLMNETEGVVSPVIDYGKFAYPSGLNEDASIDTDTYLPSVYYKTVLDKIFSEAGYSKSGSIFDRAKIAKIIIAYSRSSFKYAEQFASDRRFSGYATGTQSIVNPVTAQAIEFTNSIIANDVYWDGTSKYQSNDSTFPTEILFTVNYSFSLDLTVTGGTVTIQVRTSSTGSDFQTHVGIGTGTYTYSFDRDAYDNSYLELRVIAASGTPTVTIDRGEITIEPDSTVRRRSNYAVYFNYLLPDVKQTDFLKDFEVMTGTIFTESDGIIYAKTLNEIISDVTNAQDWTDKRVSMPDEITFAPFSYAQRNNFKYSESDSLVNKGFGDGNFTIDNTTLDNSKTIYTALSAATLTSFLPQFESKMLIARIEAYESSERIYIINLTGSSGTAAIEINGLTYIATFNSTLAQTVTDFITDFADNILSDTGVTVESVDGDTTALKFTHPTDVIIISPSNIGGTLNATPTESSQQKQTDDSKISNNPGIRYLLVRDKYSFEPNVSNETNTPVSNYKVGYFFDPNQDDSLMWDQWLENISQFSEAIQKAKVVTRSYLLDETDISQITFLTPIFDTDSYYLLNTVGPFVSGKVTKVELLKI